MSSIDCLKKERVSPCRGDDLTVLSGPTRLNSYSKKGRFGGNFNDEIAQGIFKCILQG
jgi:hypothetical protein